MKKLILTASFLFILSMSTHAATYRVQENFTCTDQTEARITYDLKISKSGHVSTTGFGTFRVLPTPFNDISDGYNTTDFQCSGLIELQKKHSALMSIDCNFTAEALYQGGNGVVVTPNLGGPLRLLNVRYMIDFSPSSKEIIGYSDPRVEEIVQINPGLDNEADFPRACSRQFSGIRINPKKTADLINITE